MTRYLVLTLCLFVVLMGFLAWNGYYSIIGTDSFHYVHAGVSLFQSGHFLNPSGKPEVWFPPTYPILIGLVSLGGRLDPLTVARLITLASAIAVIALLFACGRRMGLGAFAVLAVGIVALNPSFLQSSTAPLSEIVCMAFTGAAFLVWLRDGSRVLLGVLIAAAYLTRPEAILAPALWCLYDVAKTRKLRPAILTAVAFLALALPYNLFLYSHSGKFLSNKSEVNLAGGRSQYYRWPREWIDPQTLTLAYYQPPVPLTRTQEGRRYLSAANQIRRDYAAVIAGGQSWAMVLSIPVCLIVAFRLKPRYRAGILAQFAYLAVLPIYGTKERYLYLSLIPLALLCAAAVMLAWERRQWWGWAALVAPLCAALSLPHHPPPPVVQREAGLQLASLLPESAVLLEGTSRVAYYAHRDQQLIFGNDVALNVRYAEKEYPGRPIYLVERQPRDVWSEQVPGTPVAVWLVCSR